MSRGLGDVYKRQEFTGFSVSFISDLERGKETCEIGKAIEIVNLLGMDLCMEKRGK